MKSLVSKVKSLFASASEPLRQNGDRLISAESEKNRGNEFLAQGDFAQAEKAYREAVRIHPGYAEAYANLGFVLLQQTRLPLAEKALRSALSYKPTLWQAHLSLGIVLQEQGCLAEAAACYEKALTFEAGLAETYWRLGIVELDESRANWSRAVDLFNKALTLEPGLPEIHSNLGFALIKLERYEEAYPHLKAMLQVKELPETHFLLGLVHRERKEQALEIEHYRRALQLDPEHSRSHFQLAFPALLAGDYRNGFCHYEHRLRISSDAPLLHEMKACVERLGGGRLWSGRSIAGESLLIISEQGLGDTIMMMRYFPLLKQRFGVASLQVLCESAIASLVAELPDVDQVRIKPAEFGDDEFDCYCFAMSLPKLFGSELNTLPDAPYLRVVESLSLKWQARLAQFDGFKVGLVWAGNSQLADDSIRSMSLSMFAPLFSLPGISWFSLQKGEPAKQLEGGTYPLVDWIDECNDLQETAALIQNLDLIIAVDTAVVHLAGALGRPTWLLNRYQTEWRWLLEREDSPWYRTMRVFRQTKPGDWMGVVEKVRAALCHLPKPSE